LYCSFRLWRNERKLFGNVDSRTAEQFADDGFVEAGGVVLDADGLPLFVEPDAADSVDLAHIVKRKQGCFSRVLLVAEEDIYDRHAAMIARLRFAGESCFRACCEFCFPPFALLRMGHPGSWRCPYSKWVPRFARNLKILEIVHDFGVGPVLRADELAADFALGVDDVGLGRAGGAEGEVAPLRFVVDGEQVDVVVDQELAIRRGIVVEIDAENDDLRHLLLQFDERGEFFKTGGAPGGPEIEDHDFAAVIAEADCSCAIDDGEVWRLCGDLRGVRAAVASADRQNKDGCESHTFQNARESMGQPGSEDSETAHISIIRSERGGSGFGPDGDCSGKK